MSEGPAWSKPGPEPKLSDVLDDPIVHLVMQRDRLTPADVWCAVRAAQLRIRISVGHGSAERMTIA